MNGNNPFPVSFFLFAGILGSALKAEFAVSCETLLALSLYCSAAALTTRFYPSDNWLNSRCLTSVIIRDISR